MKFFSGNRLETYSLKDIDMSKAEALLTETPQGFIIAHPEIGIDTIRNLQNFANFQAIVSSLKSADLMANLVSDVEEEGASGLSQGLPMFVVDVSGTRESGQKLTFSIENYDETVSYLVDFGNGVRRTMRERTSYSYPRQGRFTMKLLASAADRGNSVYAKEFTISPAKATPTPETTLAAAVPSPEVPNIPIEETLLDTTAAESATLDIADLNVEDAPVEGEIPSTLVASTEEDILIDAASLAPANVAATPTTPTPAASAIMAPLVASEVMPEYPGGTKALARYFRRNARYPRQARNNNVEGVVYIRFIVNGDGSLSNPIVIKGLGYGCDEEALRLVRNMPAWVPGEQEGQAVPVYQAVPVTFKLVN